MKLSTIWKSKTLENLRKKQWPAYDSDSYLIRHTKQLRKIPLSKFTFEDLRIMISQNIELDYLIPLALERLQENTLPEGNFHKGDLLLAVVNSQYVFWTINSQYKTGLIKLVNNNKAAIEKEGIEILSLIK